MGFRHGLYLEELRKSENRLKKRDNIQKGKNVNMLLESINFVRKPSPVVLRRSKVRIDIRSGRTLG